MRDDPGIPNVLRPWVWRCVACKELESDCRCRAVIMTRPDRDTYERLVTIKERWV